MSYIEFFGFKENPFRITPDISYFYSAPSHTEALQSLKYFSESDEGFMVIIGEPGTGKTITLRKFLNDIPDNIEYAYILFPSLEPEDMFKAVLEDFGFTIDPGISKNTLFARFRDFLTDKKKQGKKLLLVIDEAQNLPVRTLEELRILSNLETEKEKLIQFVLAGQPELEKKLSSAELRQMKQRVTLHVPLRNMDFNEMSKYVAFRLSSAGFQGQYPDTAFYNVLYSLTSGVPRIVNLMMERTLMAAFVDQNRLLTPAHLNSAAISLRITPEKKTGKLLTYASAAMIALLCAGGATYYYKNIYATRLRIPEPQAAVTAPVAQPKSEAAPKPLVKPAPATAVPAQPTADQPQQTATPTDINTAKPQPTPQPAVKASVTAPKAVTTTTAQKASVQKPAQQKPAAQTKQEQQPESIIGRKGIINVGILNIRSNPGLTETVVAKMRAGQSVTIQQETEEWYKVSFFNNNGVDSGWVFRKYIKLK